MDINNKNLIDIVNENINIVVSKINIIKNKLKNNEISNLDAIRTIKSILPESFIQKRRISMNYAVLKTIYSQRKKHKLVEWQILLDYLKENLPLSNLVII